MHVIKAPGKGFTLIELIAGIVIFAVAISAMTSILFPHATKSVDPIYQVRAAELGQSLLNEIMGKAFDENTDYSSGTRCGEVPTKPCTPAGRLGPEDGETVADYDDVDDYDDYDQSKAQLDSASAYSNLYKNFRFKVTVNYDGSYSGAQNNNITFAKRVDIVITTPGGEEIRFAAYKANF